MSLNLAAALKLDEAAETARIARGFGTDAPNARHASVKRLRSSAFIGLP